MDKKFADGFIFKKQDNAPSFVVGRLSIKADEAIQFIKDNVEKGWLNIDILESKEGGKFYCQLNNWKKPESESTPPVEPQPAQKPPKQDDAFAKARAIPEDELPF